MNGHVEEKLSNYLDGGLERTAEERVRAHLRRCPDCRAALDELRDVVRRAKTLEDRAPERDLWPDIASRIGPSGKGLRSGPTSGADRSPGEGHVDGARRSASGTESPWNRTLAVPVRSLTAAAALLLAVSLGAGWLLGRASKEAAPAAGREVAASTRSALAGDVGDARTAAMESRYAEAIAELEAELAARRDRLAPATREALTGSLASIDTAIAEARAALDRDAGVDSRLPLYLSETYRRKVEVLKVALEMTGGD